MIKKHVKSLITTLTATGVLLTALPLSAQEEITVTRPQAKAEVAPEDRVMQSMQFVLKRAELIRLLSAEHLNYLDSQNATSEVRLIEDGSEVMAYGLICNDETFEPRILNRIAAEATLKIALLVESSPIKARMTETMGELPADERMTLVADIASTVLMFKIGRRRGLFDALLTDFGNARFCKGMGSSIRKRYNNLAVFLDDKK